MPQVDSVTLPLGGEIKLRISTLPSLVPGSVFPLLDARNEGTHPNEAEPIQLLEGAEYRYEVLGGESWPSIQLEPIELFQPDDSTGLSGRLRPGLSTGQLNVVARSPSIEIGRGAMEVRAKKLDYLSHYRWMLRDIAVAAAELVMERFAATEQRFSLDDRADARTLYQRFEFLSTMLADADFEAALREVMTRPYVAWEQIDEVHPPQLGLRLSGRSARLLTMPGPRVPWPAGPLPSLPSELFDSRTEATLDNVPNRFVKYALTSWRDLCLAVHRALMKQRSNQPVERGIRETQDLIERLEGTLTQQPFREAGHLNYIPSANPVLQKRAGYRDLYRAFLAVELAAKLAWTGGDEV
jgi:Domain of unknown function (DUF2357)